MTKFIRDLHDECDRKGVTIRDCGGGHYRLTGAQTVNYYPLSKRRTLVGANGQPLYMASHDEAVKLALKEHKASVAVKKALDDIKPTLGGNATNVSKSEQQHLGPDFSAATTFMTTMEAEVQRDRDLANAAMVQSLSGAAFGIPAKHIVANALVFRDMVFEALRNEQR